MSPRWSPAVLALALALPCRAEEALESGFASLSGDVKTEGAALAERLGEPKTRRQVVRIISWNLQAFGANITPEREAAYKDIMGHMLSETRSARILSFQEIANGTGAAKISGMLPGGDGDRWRGSFTNTDGAMDNGFFAEKSVGMDCERPLFAKQDETGRWRRDREQMMHTPRASHMRVGGFDFTLVTVHLTFGGANRAGTAKELGTLLDWLHQYLAKPGADPDVIITGDFNLPTRRGRTDERGPSIEDVMGAHPLGRTPAGTPLPPWGLVTLVDAPTSRNDTGTAHNYDHVIMTGDAYNEEYAAGSAGVIPPQYINSVEAKHGVRVSDHYPISAGFFTEGAGNDGRPIGPDGDSACQALMAMAPLSFQ
ncbi:hypothetical protein EPO15_16640 [bacterium]|nr:MAG: hypothetical protein EPO15_16640 [bacterium]